MSEERRDGWLMRLLSKPVFGTTQPGKPRPKFDELSHSERQMALLRGERNLRFMLLLVLWKGSLFAMILSLLVGGVLSELADWPLMSFLDPDAEHPSELLMQALPGWALLLFALHAVIRWSGQPSRWAIARWPKRFAVWYTDEQQRRAFELTSGWINGVLLAVIPLVALAMLITGSMSGFVIFSICSGVVMVIAYGCVPAGSTPCCRKCYYELPVEEPLPERCPECGVALTEPWGRRLGRSRKSPTWRAVLLALWLLPIVLGAAMFP